MTGADGIPSEESLRAFQTTHPLVRQLSRFNRKERYALLGEALGQKPFVPAYSFVHRYLAACEVSIRGVSQAWCWMDYHLDWAWAALRTVGEDGSHLGKKKFESPEWPTIDGFLNVNANQEDTDLLLAVTDDDELHLFFIEAKWQTPWTSKQVLSKLGRLNHLATAEVLQPAWVGVHPHFVLTSPVESEALSSLMPAEQIARWQRSDGKLPFVPMAAPKHRHRIVRVDVDGPALAGEFWMVDEAQW